MTCYQSSWEFLETSDQSVNQATVEVYIVWKILHDIIKLDDVVIKVLKDLKRTRVLHLVGIRAGIWPLGRIRVSISYEGYSIWDIFICA